MSSPGTTWSSGRFKLAPSRHYLACWWAADGLALLAIWCWPPLPVSGLPAITLAVAISLLLLGHAWQGWHRYHLLALQLHLLPRGELTVELADGRRYQARLRGQPGLSGWVCRVDLDGSALPRFLRPLILFRDSFDEASWRGLCRWLVANGKKEAANGR